MDARAAQGGTTARTESARRGGGTTVRTESARRGGGTSAAEGERRSAAAHVFCYTQGARGAAFAVAGMARPPSDRNAPTLSTVQALAVASQFGVTLAVSVVLGVLAGQWLDAHFNTGIIFTLIGVLVGLFTAGTTTVRLYRATMRKTEATFHAQAHTQTMESARHAPAPTLTGQSADADADDAEDR